jgi:hypothetical protein
MPRYIVERMFRDPMQLATTEPARGALIRRNPELGVTCLHAYVSDGARIALCVYDAPTADAIRASASADELPVGRILEVRVLDPYAYPAAKR